MNESTQRLLQSLPGIDSMLRHAASTPLLALYGRQLVTEMLREVLAERRKTLGEAPDSSNLERHDEALIALARERLENLFRPSLRTVFNLSGTVLHTNLGRAPLPAEAIEALSAVARGASNLEFDVARGSRGDRDAHLEDWLCRLTGAEAATIVNNNAAAVMLVLNTLARRKEVIVSRGELVEIGGSFRIPDVMTRAGAKLAEVGTTNRTHLADYEQRISSKTSLIMRVHTSNYEIQGYTASVPEGSLAATASRHEIPFVVDLGSGSLIDLSQFGLPAEPTVGASLENGADLVTFSGDKLLGGPQAGLIVGRRDLIARIKRNPMKRALRVDKLTIAALGAVLRLYADPDRLVARLPSLGLLTRTAAEIEAQARRLAPAMADTLGSIAAVTPQPCVSQIGSGAQPVETLPSYGLLCAPLVTRGRGRAVARLARGFRELPRPVIGRIEDDALLFDLRCLDDEAVFTAQLKAFVRCYGGDSSQ